MDMTEILLIIHLIGAAALAVLMVASLVAVLRHHEKYYRPLAVAVGIGTGIQLVSGSVLSMAAGSSVALFCSRIGIYLLAVLVVEVLLSYKIRATYRDFPAALVSGPTVIGLLAAGVTLFSL